VTLRRGLGLIALVVIVAGTMQAVGAWSRARLGPQIVAAARPGDIRMIGSITCTYCDQARQWFESHRVPFSECLIERDANCAGQYAALRAPGTPVLIVRGHPIVGFSAQAVADALAAPRVQ
jgi:glutaredoxin